MLPKTSILRTRMWANAQRDGRPAEHRWRPPSVQRSKVWLTPTTRCRAVTLPRRETKFEGVPQTPEPLSAVSGPKFIFSGHVDEISLLNKFFFRLSIHALVAKIWPDKLVRWCPDGNFWRLFCVLYLQRATCSRFQTCILNPH